ncbi:MAG: hypothetical protein R2856_39105 [Caldilineaceae bacterium]
MLEINDLKVYYATHRQRHVVDNVSFKVYQGEITWGWWVNLAAARRRRQWRSCVWCSRPARIVGGEILLDGINLATLQGTDLRAVRWDKLALIPQGAVNSLNPVMRISKQIADAIETHEGRILSKELKERIIGCCLRWGCPAVSTTCSPMS